MERIVIEVEDDVAKKWHDASSEVRQRLEKNIEQQIRILSRSEQQKKFFMLLDKISDEAVKNGLTEEILEKLLNEE